MHWGEQRDARVTDQFVMNIDIITFDSERDGIDP